MEEILSQVRSTDKDESKIIIVDEISTEESESECVHKNINKEKYAKNKEEHEKTTITDDPIVVKEPIYFKIFRCGKNILNRIDATCERLCMETPRDKYYMELYRTIKYCNDRNGAPLSNDNIRDVMNRVIIEEEAEAHNVTMDNFSKTPATTNKK